MGLLATLRFIWNHPIASQRRTQAIKRYVWWQLGSRLSPGPIVVDFVNDARLVVRPHMRAATGNVYVGLFEPEDMSFVLHALRPADVFVDVGANVGSYTVLASRGVGARCVAFEPVPSAFAALLDNVSLNGVADRVELHREAVGDESAKVAITLDYDALNHVTKGEHHGVNVLQVDMLALDSLASVRDACIVKIDVEGFERSVLQGARAVLANPKLLAVVMETHTAFGERNAAAHELALELGLSPYTYAPFERRLISLGRDYKPDANTIYVRDLDALRERIRTGPTFNTLGLRM
jgi:FkbM family methyltransferase